MNISCTLKWEADELMVHAGLPATTMVTDGDEYAPTRVRELAVLTDERVVEAVANYRIQCVDFSFVRQSVHLSV
jgi:predicted glycoside hydrolase/deacetylase ChbG (UPF0249 family)